MHAEELTLKQLLAGKVVYVTPSFQRPYGRADEAVAQTLGAALDAGGAPCFCGALVTRTLGTPGGYAKSLLIDGNQRLATLLVLLLAIRDAIRGDMPEAAERLNALCFVNAGEGAPSRFKNLLAKRDRTTFERTVDGKGAPDPGHPLAQAYARCAEACAPLSAERLREVARRILSDFSFVVFSLGADDDPYPVFKLFNPADDEFTRLGRDTYRQFASDPELMDLIAGGESQEVEFKAHAIVQGKHGREEGSRGVGTVVRAVAAMLNSTVGGTILVGVEDDGAICGIEDEYPLADKGKSNWDGFQLRLANTLRSRLEARNAFLHYAIQRRRAGLHDVCMIHVTPSEEPVYVDKRLFVRTLNQTVEMLGPDLVDYVARRFGHGGARQGEGNPPAT